MNIQTVSVRRAVIHATCELTRISAEIDAVSRLLRRSHELSGSTVGNYRDGELYPALVLAADAIEEAVGQTTRFLELQIGELRDPLDTLRTFDDERCSDRVL